MSVVGREALATVDVVYACIRGKTIEHSATNFTAIICKM